MIGRRQSRRPSDHQAGFCSIEQDFGDVAALVDAVAVGHRQTGSGLMPILRSRLRTGGAPSVTAA